MLMEDLGAEGDAVGEAEDIEVEDPLLPISLSFETFVVFAFTLEVIFFATAPFAALPPILPSAANILYYDPQCLCLSSRSRSCSTECRRFAS